MGATVLAGVEIETTPQGEGCPDRVRSALQHFSRGKREEYLRLSDQAMDVVRTKHSGTLGYDLYINGDQSDCMIIERYRDSEAAIEQAANLGHLFAEVHATVSVVHGELLGEPSAELYCGGS